MPYKRIGKTIHKKTSNGWIKKVKVFINLSRLYLKLRWAGMSVEKAKKMIKLLYLKEKEKK